MVYDISNQQVLQVIFGDQYPYAHVTSFRDDPSAITNDRKAICWAGDYYYKYNLEPQSNQFFCVSLFGEIDGRSRRRKSHFSATYVIGLDDVNEKLPPEMVARLPAPTYKMNSSKGSEQWFYKLATPEQNQNRVDNLLDQLIINGLAPDGNDPGMKGVTRYLRLPEGVNTKSKRVAENGGVPYQCQITEWNPERSFTLEQLAEPFNVDLNAQRREVRTSGTVDIPDHPLLKFFNIKSTLGPGKYDITCPWIDDHSDNDDSGTALFTNDDGSIGFHCHHGHCESKTATDVLKMLDESTPGIRASFNSWRNAYQSISAFSSVAPMDFMGKELKPITQSYDFMGDTEKKPDIVINYQDMMNDLRRELPQTPEQLSKCERFLHTIDPLPHAQKMRWYDEIQQVMGWTKSDLNKSVSDFRKSWYTDSKNDMEFYKELYFVTSLNQFYHPIKNINYSTEAFQNAYCHLDEQARNTALVAAMTRKVDAIDYVPGKPEVFEEHGIEYANTYRGDINYGAKGECDIWLDHWQVLGWESHREQHLMFMANTIRRPETKINWAILMASREGTGKDFLLYPLMMAMNRNSSVVNGEELTSQFNEYLLNKKHVHFNEVEMGDHAQNREIANKLKPIITAPPERIPLNIKGMRRMSIKNVANITITSNSYQPVYVDRGSRRYYMTWSDLQTRDEQGQVLPEWVKYWDIAWHWMLDESDGGLGGWRHCVHHLVHRVDISEFNPRSAPPVTDYMREVQQMSKSALEIEIEDLIMNNVGAFACDLVTNNEAVKTVQMHTTLGRGISPNTMTKILTAIGCKPGLRCLIDGKQTRIVAIRDVVKYGQMDPSTLSMVYTSQHQAMQSQGNVVKFG